MMCLRVCVHINKLIGNSLQSHEKTSEVLNKRVVHFWFVLPARHMKCSHCVISCLSSSAKCGTAAKRGFVSTLADTLVAAFGCRLCAADSTTHRRVTARVGLVIYTERAGAHRLPVWI